MSGLKEQGKHNRRTTKEKEIEEGENEKKTRWITNYKQWGSERGWPKRTNREIKRQKCGNCEPGRKKTERPWAMAERHLEKGGGIGGKRGEKNKSIRGPALAGGLGERKRRGRQDVFGGGVELIGFKKAVTAGFLQGVSCVGGAETRGHLDGKQAQVTALAEGKQHQNVILL